MNYFLISHSYLYLSFSREHSPPLRMVILYDTHLGTSFSQMLKYMKKTLCKENRSVLNRTTTVSQRGVFYSKEAAFPKSDDGKDNWKEEIKPRSLFSPILVEVFLQLCSIANLLEFWESGVISGRDSLI